MAATAANIAFDTDARDRIAAIPARLRETFRTGRTRPAAWRKEQLRAIEQLLKENTQRFEEALRKDLGKPAFEAYTTDLGFPLGEAALALKNLDSWMRPQRAPLPAIQKPGKAWIQFDPLGVVLIIAPWNYPVQLTFNPLVAAVAAGNCAVVKPSEMTPATSALIAELIPRYMDNDCIAVVEGAVEETTLLLEQPFDHIFYTGNGRVGRVVMAAAARHLTPVTLELGGKSPCIVMPDADLDVAAHRIAWGKWTNAGQTCTAPDYVLVHSEVEEELVEKLKETLAEFYGDDPKASDSYGRIVGDRHVERLASVLQDDVEVVAGGQIDRAQRYVAPTIVRAKPTAKVMEDEIFGPILPILTVESEQEAIDFINEREKPLALYVFTSDNTLAQRVLGETSSGGACVNATLWHVANPNLPFGGVGPSGMGSYHGRWGFECFSHRKAVVQKPTRMDPKVAYPPYTRMKEWLARKFM
ncbi:MAG TPA: aldehyde dehydrogenase family protein [Candidatus Limnocylindrales bacterium]|nr:aldehyde dehydrogenase family protein [Candidatus Limnocylindrales bacterium]